MGVDAPASPELETTDKRPAGDSPPAAHRLGVYTRPKLRVLPAPSLWSATAYVFVFIVMAIVLIRLARPYLSRVRG